MWKKNVTQSTTFYNSIMDRRVKKNPAITALLELNPLSERQKDFILQDREIVISGLRLWLLWPRANKHWQRDIKRLSVNPWAIQITPSGVAVKRRKYSLAALVCCQLETVAAKGKGQMHILLFEANSKTEVIVNMLNCMLSKSIICLKLNSNGKACKSKVLYLHFHWHYNEKQKIMPYLCFWQSKPLQI